MTPDNLDSTELIRSEKPLTNGFKPEEPVGREGELSELIESLQPLAHRKSPQNLLIHGSAGIGKSVCVNHSFEFLEQETSLKTVYINCWQYNTRSSLLAQLLIKMGYPAPRKGKPVDELLSRVREWLDKTQSIAVALDEFDQLQEQNEVIYDLQHLSESADNDFGLVLVSNQHPSEIELDPRCESRLSCQTLEFHPYTTDELEKILRSRAEEAFHPETVSDEVIQEIAETVAQRNGDCREALEKLLRTGRIAERAGDRKVTQKHLDLLNNQD